MHERSNLINVRYRDQQSATNGIAATIGFQGAGGARRRPRSRSPATARCSTTTGPTRAGRSTSGARATSSLSALMVHSPDDISGFTTLTRQRRHASVTLPFSVTIEGTSYSTLTISTNGWIEFGDNTPGANPTRQRLPAESRAHEPVRSSATGTTCRPQGTNIRYGTVGTSPNRTFIVDFEDERWSPQGAATTSTARCRSTSART